MRLVVVLRFATVGTWRNLRLSRHAKVFQFGGGDGKVGFWWMVGMSQELGIQPQRTDRRRILVTRLMQNESLVLNA